MKKQSKLKKYTELFKKNIKANIAPGIRISSKIYPIEAEGAIFEFTLSKNEDEDEKISSNYPTIGDALSNIKQNLVGGDIKNVKFKGTSLYLEDNRILIIKGDKSTSGWNGDEVKDDVKRVISTSIKKSTN